MQYGCIGEKLGHSFSKIIHNELAGYNYELCEISRENFPEFMNKSEFKAINVTIPYKEEVIPYLNEIDCIAKKIGAVNTVVNKNGKLYGYNTDFFGLSALIKREKISFLGKKVLILGSGGTSKTASAVAESLSAASVYRISRNGREGLITYEDAYQKHIDADIIINTTPCGMYPDIIASPVEISRFSNLSAVIDVIYNPLNSALVTEAKARDIHAVGGLYMLVSQAVFAAEKFIDTNFPESVTEKIYKKIYKEKHNIVLIGMPSCGKTTIGRKIADDFKKEFIDTDEEIEKALSMSISDFIVKYGIDDFRKYEEKVIIEVSANQNCVIATGGGAVLKKENVKILKQNGSLIFIDRPLENLITTNDRPLSSNRDDLEKRYNERYNIYLSSADLTVKVGSYSDSDVKIIEEGYLNEILGN